MMPMKARQPSRAVRAFDVITPEGRAHRFPEQTWLQRIAARIHSLAEPVILLAVVLLLAYSAGILADAIQPIISEACPDPAGLPKDV